MRIASQARNSGGTGTNTGPNPAGAPPLDTWIIPTQPYKGSHYATFPDDLVVKPVRMMCPERVCRVCGEPSRRIVGDAEYVKPNGDRHDFHGGALEPATGPVGKRNTQTGSDNGNYSAVRPTLGWTDCGHDDWRNGLVLDPFAGSGTTLGVAIGHGRDAIGIDLDERNAELARERVGMWLTVEP